MLWDEKDCVYCADKQNAAAVAEIQLPRHFFGSGYRRHGKDEVSMGGSIWMANRYKEGNRLMENQLALQSP